LNFAQNWCTVISFYHVDKLWLGFDQKRTVKTQIDRRS